VSRNIIGPVAPDLSLDNAIALLIVSIYNAMVLLSSKKIIPLHYSQDMQSDFKRNLRNELNYQDLTVKELSVKTAIPKPTLDCYLGTRTSMPPADVAVKIASALGVTVEYLVIGNIDNHSGDLSKYFKFQDILDDLLLLPKHMLNPIKAMIKTAADQERKKISD
jgi:transcriptional regulator with XRE-family HTH domain